MDGYLRPVARTLALSAQPNPVSINHPVRLDARIQPAVTSVIYSFKIDGVAEQANQNPLYIKSLADGRTDPMRILSRPSIAPMDSYVDLNPLRAGLAETPETSDYTSIQEGLGCLPQTPVEA
jgi:hypothetical protein